MRLLCHSRAKPQLPTIPHDLARSAAIIVLRRFTSLMGSHGFRGLMVVFDNHFLLGGFLVGSSSISSLSSVT